MQLLIDKTGEILYIFSGSAPYDKPGSVFAFSVSWDEGKSTTAWTGTSTTMVLLNHSLTLGMKNQVVFG